MAQGQKVLVGCRLPNGLILKVKEGEKETIVTVKGLNKTAILGAPYVTTEVDAEFWEAWKKLYPTYGPLKNGAIFEARTVDQAEYKGKKEFAKEPTGLESLSQTAHNVKPATKKEGE